MTKAGAKGADVPKTKAAKPKTKVAKPKTKAAKPRKSKAKLLKAKATAIDAETADPVETVGTVDPVDTVETGDPVDAGGTAVDPGGTVAELLAEPIFDGGGTYRRDEAGVWRYTVGGEPVPGARDLRLGELYDPEAHPDDPTLRVVPRHWVGLRPGHPLAWAMAYGELGTRTPFLVPADEWSSHVDNVVGMLAPELHPSRLLAIDEVASIAGISEVTVRAYVHRRQMPQPVSRVGGSPVWSRPVIEQWLRGRRRGRRSAAEVGAATGFPSADDDG